MIKVKGKITCETDKALQLEIIEDERRAMIGLTIWWPKKKIRLSEKEISIEIPEWLYNSKEVEVQTQEQEQKLFR